MIAALPMYDFPGLRAGTDALWSAIRAELGRGPADLTRDRDMWEIWRDPGLLFAQTCGLPYRARLHGTVRLVGTPDYALPGCPPGHYNSVLILRADDPRGEADLTDAPFAFNEALSQSGWAAPLAHMAARGLSITPALQTGAHALSARAVAEGRADWAAIDALTWEFLCRFHPEETGRLRVFARTLPSPALPYITGPGEDAPAIRAAVARAIGALPAATRTALHLHGIVALSPEAYLALPVPPAPVLAA